MNEIDIHLRELDDESATIARIDEAIEAHGLLATMKGSLKTYPGSTHWHCKRGRETGTLEITYWPTKRRAWFKVQNGRRADWIDQIVPRMKRSLET